MPSTLSETTYDIGDRVRLGIAIQDLESVGAPLVDPDQLVFTMRSPDGTLTTWTYGVDEQFVKDDVGLYHVNWTVVQRGNHWSRFVASGNVGAAEELGFKVRPSKVVP